MRPMQPAYGRSRSFQGVCPAEIYRCLPGTDIYHAVGSLLDPVSNQFLGTYDYLLALMFRVCGMIGRVWCGQSLVAAAWPYRSVLRECVYVSSSGDPWSMLAMSLLLMVAWKNLKSRFLRLSLPWWTTTLGWRLRLPCVLPLGRLGAVGALSLGCRKTRVRTSSSTAPLWAGGTCLLLVLGIVLTPTRGRKNSDSVSENPCCEMVPATLRLLAYPVCPSGAGGQYEWYQEGLLWLDVSLAHVAWIGTLRLLSCRSPE